MIENLLAVEKTHLHKRKKKKTTGIRAYIRFAEYSENKLIPNCFLEILVQEWKYSKLYLKKG